MTIGTSRSIYDPSDGPRYSYNITDGIMVELGFTSIEVISNQIPYLISYHSISSLMISYKVIIQLNAGGRPWFYNHQGYINQISDSFL